MKDKFSLQQKDLDALLGWLSADREEAGRQYEKIREGLIRFFRFRGCADPSTLADETFNRFALKLDTLDFSKNLKKYTYIYGFAKKVLLEYLRTAEKQEISLDSDDVSSGEFFYGKRNPSEEKQDCLEKCLEKVSAEDREIIIRYYESDKNERVEARKKLAEEMNLQMSAMQTKVSRLKDFLRVCIEICLEKK